MQIVVCHIYIILLSLNSRAQQVGFFDISSCPVLKKKRRVTGIFPKRGYSRKRRGRRSVREKKLRIFCTTKVLDFQGHWELDGGGKIHETCLNSIFLLHEAQLHLQSCISSFNYCQSRHDYHESVRED